jgi:hypothetical protein
MIRKGQPLVKLQMKQLIVSTKRTSIILVVFVVIAVNMYQNMKSATNTLQSFEVTPSKPRHCRPNLPGCVPKFIDYIVTLHIPKAGGTTLFEFFKTQKNKQVFDPQICGLTPALWPQSFCSGLQSPAFQKLPGPEIDMDAKQRNCQLQRNGLEQMQKINVFENLNCNSIVIGHYDFGLVDALPKEVRERTLVIATLRSPNNRVLSAYYHLLKLDGRGIIKGVGLQKFAEQGVIDEDTVNRMTKTLAGDYCCYSEALSESERWQRALHNLYSTVGAVTILEKMEESLEYISWLLEWTKGNTSLHVRPNPHPTSADPAVETALRIANTMDEKLYYHGLEQFNQQLDAMRGQR